MKMNKDEQLLLIEELNEYEKYTELSDSEKEDLHKWVSAGNSVHENGCQAVDDHGDYLDFIEVYREEQYISDRLSTMNEEEQEDFVAELRGEDTIRTLRRKYNDICFRKNVYEYVLRKHHLLDEAVREMDAARERSRAFSESMSDEVRMFMEGGAAW